MDYSLTDMELTAFLRKIGKMMPLTQIIVVADKTSLRKVMEMVGKVSKKPYAYLLKPFEMETAIAMIKEQLRKQQ